MDHLGFTCAAANTAKNPRIIERGAIFATSKPKSRRKKTDVPLISSHFKLQYLFINLISPRPDDDERQNPSVVSEQNDQKFGTK